jgi:transposase
MVTHRGKEVQMFVGVDSHKDTLAACVVDGSGREVRSSVFRNTPSGHREFHDWAGRAERFGIEGSANLGAALARMLMATGEIVCEVPS